MRTIHPTLPLPLLAAFLALGAAVAVAGEARLVAGGRPVAVTEHGAAWTLTGDGESRAMTGSGIGNLLLANVALGMGEFHLQVRLRIDDLEGSAASIVLGDSHLGFSGRNGAMFAEGGLFTQFAPAFNAAAVRVPAGQPFALELVRRDGELLVLIDGKELHHGPFPDRPIDTIGLRPWRARLHVHELWLEGAVSPRTHPAPRHVFAAGEGGVHTYRIPALAVAVDGTLLAFAEARHTGSGDAGDIDVVLRRSTDGGATWGEILTIWDDGANTCGNPCAVVDRATGTVHLLMTHNLGGDRESEIIAGESEGTRTVWVTASEDAGLSWKGV